MCFLVILAFIVPFQNTLSDGPKIISYYEYNKTNKVDYLIDMNLNPAIYNLTENDYNNSYNIGMNVKNTEHYAMMAFISLDHPNITLTDGYGNNKTIQLSSSLTIGGISDTELNQLQSLDLVTLNSSFTNSDSLLSKDLVKLSNSSSLTKVDLTQNDSLSLGTTGNFSWHSNSYVDSANYQFAYYPNVNLSTFNSVYIIFLPIDKFIQLFKGQITNIKLYVGVNREKEFSISKLLNYDPNKHNNQYSLYMSIPIKTMGHSIFSLTDEVFTQITIQTADIDIITFALMIIPVLIITIFLALSLVNQWEDQFLKNWLYFKAKGLKFTTFRISYLLFGLLIAFLSTMINFVLFKILRFIAYKILYNYSSFDLMNNAFNLITLNFIFLSIICLFAFHRTISKFEKQSWKEVQKSQFDKKPSSLFKNIFSLSIVTIVIGFLLLFIPNIENLLSQSVIISFWKGILQMIIYTMAPFGLIVGTAGLLSQHYDSIEKNLLKIIPFIKLPNVKALHLSESKKFTFLFILLFSIQLFMTLYITNYTTNYNQQQLFNNGGDYSATFMGNFSQQEIAGFNNNVFATGSVDSSMSSIKFNTLAYSGNTTNAIQLFQLKDSNLPVRYQITSNDRTILQNAFSNDQGIVLSNGLSYSKENIFITMINITKKINLVSQHIKMPGFFSDQKVIIIMLPTSINMSSFSDLSVESIFYFSKDGPNQKVDDTIVQIARNYEIINYGEFLSSKYISIEYGGIYDYGYTTPLETQIVVLNATVYFSTLITLFGYIFLITVSLNSKKKIFGVLLSKGLSKKKLKLSLLIDNLILLIMSLGISFVIAYISVYDLLIYLFPNVSIPFPTIQYTLLIGDVLLLILIYLMTYIILSIVLRKRNVVDYLEKSF